MVFPESFPSLALAFAVLVVIADLWADRDRRARMLADHRAWWGRLQTATYSQLISNAAAGFYGFPAIKSAKGTTRRTARDWSRFYQIAIAFLILGMLATGSLIAGAALFAPDPQAVISHALSFFAVPSAAVALAWLIIVAGLLSTIARTSSAPLQVLLVFLLAAGSLFMWVALMHLGTWFEWQVKRTPTAYGTEWFYAEVYMQYVREPAGRVVSLTAALIAGLPVAPCLLRIVFLTACKFLRPVLTPLLERMVSARKGVLGLLALLAALLAGALGG